MKKNSFCCSLGGRVHLSTARLLFVVVVCVYYAFFLRLELYEKREREEKKKTMRPITTKFTQVQAKGKRKKFIGPCAVD